MPPGGGTAELKEETGVDAPYLQQLSAYGNRDRDPRDWVAKVAYFALLPAHLLPASYADPSIMGSRCLFH